MMRGQAGRIARVVAAGVASILLLGSAPAQAAPEQLEFSSDGTAWSAAPPAALYSDGIRLVPGGVTTATIWVRNGAADSGILVAAIAGVEASSADAAWGFGITASDDAGAGMPRTAVEAVADCTQVVAPRVLAPGEALAITVAVDLSAAVTGDRAQNDHVSFDLRIGLTDAAAGVGAVVGCPAVPVEIPSEPTSPGPAPSVPTPSDPTPPPTSPPSGEGALPATGGQFTLGVVVVGLLTGAAGWMLMLLARRKRRRA